MGAQDLLPIEWRDFYGLDRGDVPRPHSLDFARLYKMLQSGAFFVTRGMSAREGSSS